MAKEAAVVVNFLLFMRGRCPNRRLKPMMRKLGYLYNCGVILFNSHVLVILCVGKLLVLFGT